LVIENTFTDMPTVARKYPPNKPLQPLQPPAPPAPHFCLYVQGLTTSLGIPGLYYLAPLLCSEKWRSINLITKLKNLPILFLAGEKDEVIPAPHMQQLYDSSLAGGGPRGPPPPPPPNPPLTQTPKPP